MTFNYFITAFGGIIALGIGYLIKSNSKSHKEMYIKMEKMDKRLVRVETKIEDKVNGGK